MSDDTKRSNDKNDNNSDSDKDDKEIAGPSVSLSNQKSNAKGEDKETIDMIKRFFSTTFGLGRQDSSTATPEKVIPDLSFEGFGSHWKKNGFKKIITMVGAGISTSAGIPDFRSPGSGLYDNLKKYNLPHPTAIFDLDYFEDNPKPFFALAKELYPGSFIPTPAHYFVRLLHDKGLLIRHYTQNIDTLDRLSGVPDDKLIEAHGSFYTNHCLLCRKEYDMAWMKAEIFADRLPQCQKCNGIVKPDIVFFGENLPDKFYSSPEEDFEDCDLLIIMGTSLEVHPFASLINRPKSKCIRLLINRDPVGNHGGHGFLPFSFGDRPLIYDSPENTRDVAYLGDCDEGVLKLAEALGWDKELQELITNERERLAKEHPVVNEKQQQKDVKDKQK